MSYPNLYFDYTCVMNQSKELYLNEPQYVWNAFPGEPIHTIAILPCGLPIQKDIETDLNLLDTLPKGRIWYNFNTEVFADSPYQNVYNEIFFKAISEKNFSISLITTSKSVMKYISILQHIRDAEIGVWFSSDTAQDNTFTQRLDILRRLYFSDIYTIVYLHTEGNIADITNLAELVSGLCHRIYLYGKQNHVVEVINEIFDEHKKQVFYIEEMNNTLFL